MRRIITASCLVGVLVMLMASTSHAQWGTLTGRFVYDANKFPTPDPITVTKDVAFCGKHNLQDQTIVVNQDNGGLKNVVVYLYLSRGQDAPTPHPMFEKTANDEVRLDNLNCHFEPHICLLRTSQTLVLGNQDPVGHNTKIDTIKNFPINPIIPANGEKKQQFPVEERLPTLVSCSIHPWMNARLVIKDTPYMAVSDADGNFEIENLPEGEWTFQVWHEAAGYLSDVKVDGQSGWRRGRFDQTISSGVNDLGEILVQPSGLQ